MNADFKKVYKKIDLEKIDSLSPEQAQLVQEFCGKTEDEVKSSSDDQIVKELVKLNKIGSIIEKALYKEVLLTE